MSETNNTPAASPAIEAPKRPAKCRGCDMTLRGIDYCYGGAAYHPLTGARCKVNYYGGYVCSRSCDHRSSLELEQSMPGHGWDQKRLGQAAQRSLDSNWPENQP